jgi:uncharacterized protein
MTDDDSELLAAIRAYAEECQLSSGSCHDFSHVERVYRLAERIARGEGADLFIVRAAALLHDIGRGLEPRRGKAPDRHEELSAELAQPFLEGLGLASERVRAIVDAILQHRHRRGREPQSLEARCLFDADKLDSLGAVGVARAYLWLGEHGRSVYYPEESWIGVDPANNETAVDSFQREWHIKLGKLKNGMYTEEGKRLAEERHERMARILAEIEEEAGSPAH